MAANTEDLILRNGTDAEFRAWASAIDARFAAFGWVRTADTGQIDFATVLTPTAADQSRGYSIFRMNDALQATTPCFVKIEYGSAGTAALPAIWTTIGTGTNGAGTLTGQVGTRIQRGFQNAPAAGVAGRCVFSGANNRLFMCVGQGYNNGQFVWWLNIERSKDNAGADTDAGISYHGHSGHNSAQLSQFVPKSGALGALEGSNLSIGPTNTAPMVVGTDVVPAPVFPVRTIALNPVRGVALYHKGTTPDIADDFVINGTIYGVAQTWYALGKAVATGARGTNLAGVLCRYE